MKSYTRFFILRVLPLTTFMLALFLQSVGQVEIEGRFHNWPTDSIFIYKLSFSAPYTIQTFGYPLDEEGRFSAKLTWIKEAQLIKIEAHNRAEFIEKNFLGSNFTPQFIGHNCIKYYKWGSLTLFAEPNEKISFSASHAYDRIKLSEEDAVKYRASGWEITQDNIWEVYGETKVYFSGENAQKMRFFQEYLKTDFDPIIEKVKTNLPEDVWQLITIEKNEKLKEVLFLKQQLGSALFNFLSEEINYSAFNYYIKYLVRLARKEEILQKEFKDFYFQEMNGIARPNVSTLMGYEQIKFMGHYTNARVSINQQGFQVAHDICSLYTYGYDDLPKKTKYQFALALFRYNRESPDREKLVSLIRKEYPKGDKNYLLKEGRP